MKKVLNINILALFLVVVCYTASAEEAEQPKPDKLQENISYFFHMKRGLEDAMGGRQPDLSKEEQEAVVAEIQSRQKKVQEMAQQQGLELARQYLVDSAKNEGVMVTESGLQYQVLVEGNGKKPTASDTVKVHYEGTLTNGQIFDSSIKRGEPVEFQLNQVIPGWTEGVQLMQVGAKFRFIIPPGLGYGAGGTRGIPPNSVLIFEVELLEVK
jgi:FKBP-type peptidyl-prolyl cis-trans isomerase